MHKKPFKRFEDFEIVESVNDISNIFLKCVNKRVNLKFVPSNITLDLASFQILISLASRIPVQFSPNVESSKPLSDWWNTLRREKLLNRISMLQHLNRYLSRALISVYYFLAVAINNSPNDARSVLAASHIIEVPFLFHAVVRWSFTFIVNVSSS